MEVFQRGEYFAVVGTLHDQRPWAGGSSGRRHLHFMDLGLVVRRADMVIVDAAADMQTFPARRVHRHRAHVPRPHRPLGGAGLLGAVQKRFGRQRGCSHLEFLARAIGPVVVQGVTSRPPGRSRRGTASTRCARAGSASWPTPCHIWTEDGPGPQKIAAGWRPGLLGYPAPRVADVRRRLAEEAGS